MQYDIIKFACLIIGMGVLGFTAGFTVLAMLIATLLILAWQMYRLRLLHLWLVSPKKNPLPETSGQLYLLHREIHRRKNSNRRRKKQLARYLKQFRKVVSALPDAIILINGNGSIEWANKNSSQLLGINWPVDANIHLGNLIRDPNFAQLLDPKNKSNKGIEILSPVDDNSFINMRCIYYTEDLRMVIARDVSRLLQVNTMHKTFVANVSHELKTPLTVLRGYIEMFSDFPNIDERMVKPIEQMAAQSQRMQLIVNDLLYLSKLEDKNYKRSQTQIDVVLLVNTIIESVQPLLRAKHHKINLQTDHNLGLLGSNDEIHSAFSNIIQNAIHYTPDNGVIDISWQTDEPSGAVFKVSDNGIGIANHHISRITERFYRIDDNRSREKGGTGLGLAIVKHVLNRHLATLDINSKLGSGSQFICHFPEQKIIEAKTTASGQNFQST